MRKKESRNEIVPAGLMSLLNKNENWDCCRRRPGKYFMRTLGWIYCFVFFYMKLFEVVFKNTKKEKEKHVGVHLSLQARWVLIQDLWARSVSQGATVGTQKCWLRGLILFFIIPPSTY